MPFSRRLILFSFLAVSTLYDATFDSWRGGYFSPEELIDPLVSGESADPDGDGMPNLMEYAFGSDPWTPSIPPITTSLADGRLQLTYRSPAAVSDLAYIPQVSSDLTHWFTGDTYVKTLSSTAIAGDHLEVVLQDYATDEPKRSCA